MQIFSPTLSSSAISTSNTHPSPRSDRFAVASRKHYDSVNESDRSSEEDDNNDTPVKTGGLDDSSSFNDSFTDAYSHLSSFSSSHHNLHHHISTPSQRFSTPSQRFSTPSQRLSTPSSTPSLHYSTPLSTSSPRTSREEHKENTPPLASGACTEGPVLVALLCIGARYLQKSFLEIFIRRS